MKVLPWLLTAALAASTGYLAWRGRPGPAAAPAHPALAASTTGAVAPALEGELAALRHCTSRLQVAQAALDRAEALRTGAIPDRTADLLRGPCTGDAAALADLEARIEAEVAARVRETAERRLSARDGRRAEIRHMVEQFLTIDESKSAALMEYVCAVREQRADVIEDVRTAKLDLKAAAARQEGQREEILADIERLLGAEKYAQLRSVGGLGKLGDLFECG